MASDAVIRLIAEDQASPVLENIEMSLTDLAKGVSAFAVSAAAAFVATGTAAVLMVSKFTNAAKATNEMAMAAGTSLGSFSALSESMGDFGVSSESVQGALSRLAVKMQEAASNGGQFTGVLGTVGVSATDSSGRMRDTTSVMIELADKFKDLGPGAQSSALAMDAFGRAGFAMIPALTQGSEALTQSAASAAATGLAFNEADITMSTAMFSAMDTISDTTSAIVNTITRGLGPLVIGTMQSISTAVEAAFSGFIAGQGGMSKAIANITNGFLEFYPVVQSGVELITFMGKQVIITAMGFTALAAGMQQARGASQDSVDTWVNLTKGLKGSLDALQKIPDSLAANIQALIDARSVQKDVTQEGAAGFTAIAAAVDKTTESTTVATAKVDEYGNSLEVAADTASTGLAVQEARTYEVARAVDRVDESIDRIPPKIEAAAEATSTWKAESMQLVGVLEAAASRADAFSKNIEHASDVTNQMNQGFAANASQFGIAAPQIDQTDNFYSARQKLSDYTANVERARAQATDNAAIDAQRRLYQESLARAGAPTQKSGGGSPVINVNPQLVLDGRQLTAAVGPYLTEATDRGQIRLAPRVQGSR